MLTKDYETERRKANECLFTHAFNNPILLGGVARFITTRCEVYLNIIHSVHKLM